MPKIQLKGIIKDVSKIGVIGTNPPAKHQTVTLLVPGFTDSYGEKRAKDELWKIHVIGEKVNHFNLDEQNILEKKANVEVYLNSNTVIRDGEPKSFISANLAKLEIRHA